MSPTSEASSRRPIPERIKEAREARGFTLEAFAERLAVTKQAVAQYETGQTTPSGQVLSRIVGEAAQPISFFISAPHRLGVPSAPFWRSLKRMELHHRRRITRRLQWASDVIDYVSEFIDIPPLNILRVDFDHDADEDERIESAADGLRELWSLGRGPILDLASTLESNGIVLIRERVACDDMDAVSCWVAGRPFVLLSDEIESGPRDLFNLAHELGHLILHAGVQVTDNNLPTIERQANRFASAFLLPRDSFSREVLGTSISYFLTLKERWGLSIAAMAYRCKDLGLLSNDQYTYVMRQMNILKIRRHEPLDGDFLVNRPSMLRQSIEMLVEHSVQNPSQIEAALGLNLRDVESLCGLPSGYLGTRVVKLQFKP